ncbi:hypothetical protein BDQ12DRAFT_640076 [Crucibulum laeve]|uniref:Uncharacterized protein n=1 Tax=Crucibulum laeve TaxID=68775 RepID=A0A5C3LGY4_9AGAR|nr:hypothetical protein BDQ12DRAFT_640076 [Crucibulum laeve]
MKALFSRRPSTCSAASIIEKKPFTPWLPPELWMLIFHHASSPSHPFLSSELITSREPLSFVDFPHSHSHLLSDYHKSIRFKASLTYVCKLWHSIGQEVLYEFVWITGAREGVLLAELLGNKVIRDVSPDGGLGKGKGKPKAFGGGSQQISHLSDTDHFDFNNKESYTYPYGTRGVGRYIRRLHIETNTLDRCSPQDLLTILNHAPLLQVYSDYQSIRRTTGFTVITPSSSSSPSPESSSRSSLSGLDHLSSSSTTAGSSTHIHSFRDHTQPQQQESDQQVLSALLTHLNRGTMLRRLSWTNYEYEPQDFEGGIRYYLRVIGPKLKRAKENLEFLELTLCAKDLRGMTGQGGTGGGFFESLLIPSTVTNVNNLTTLSASLASTAMTAITSSMPSSSVNISRMLSSETLRSISSASPLVLPALRSLKVTLDNATFHVLSTWNMPDLKNLSVISADFSYAGEGFASFFKVHGSKIVQLELGHSTGAIEGFWSTAPHLQQNYNSNSTNQGWMFGSTQVPLANWCPNLLEFICSADAEWNWQNPDWIAPHILLPAHPMLQFIGVHDMEKCILEALSRIEYRDLTAVQGGHGFTGLDDKEYSNGIGGIDDPFFMLQEQIGSLLRMEAFPALQYIRDLSFGSEVMRQSGRVRVKGDGSLDDYEHRDNGSDSSLGSKLASISHLGRGSLSSSLVLNAGQCMATWASVLPPSSSQQPIDARPTGRQLKLLQEHQQGLRVLRFWVKVVQMFKERDVLLQDCNGFNVSFESLKSAVVVNN